jgi:hypothetical protein
VEKNRKHPKGSPQDIIQHYGTTVKISVDDFKDLYSTFDPEKARKELLATMSHHVDSQIMSAIDRKGMLIRPRDEGGGKPTEGDIMEMNLDGAVCRLRYKNGEWITESRWDRVSGNYLALGELSSYAKEVLAHHTLSNLGD